MASKGLPPKGPGKAKSSLASSVKQGLAEGSNPKGTKPSPPGGALSTTEYVHGIRRGDRRILSQAITKIESKLPRDQQQAEMIIQKLLPHNLKSIRIAVSGMPGAGKSTIIEKLGTHLIQKGNRVAVLAIDPTSSLSHGSILGDKTRMEELSRSDNAFIRPSPTAGNLGGVTRKTRETIITCEAAGFNIILLETVGVGQSEIAARSMVDFFTLVLIPGSGDELQGIKRGIMEISDLVVINKADGNRVAAAGKTCRKFQNALELMAPATRGWQPRPITCSALHNRNIQLLWQIIEEFTELTRRNRFFFERRARQSYDWFTDILNQQIIDVFYRNPAVQKMLPKLKTEILNQNTFPPLAVQQIIRLFRDNTG